MQIYQIAQNALGLDVSNRENTYGCVEAVTTLLQIAGIPMKERLSTIKIYKELLTDNRFAEVTDIPKPSDIIITATESNRKRGHMGIIGEDGVIFSNNSDTYLWDNVLSIIKWERQYRGMKTKIFRLKGVDEGMNLETCKMQLQKEVAKNQEAFDYVINLLKRYFKVANKK